MEEVVTILLGIAFLVIGWFAGEFLARVTKEELKSGRKWFKLIVLVSLLGMIISLILENDALMFSFAFIAIVTSRSLKKQ